MVLNSLRIGATAKSTTYFAIFFLFVVSTLSLPFYRFHLTTTATTYVTGMKWYWGGAMGVGR